jgi:hypothetical protein
MNGTVGLKPKPKAYMETTIVSHLIALENEHGFVMRTFRADTT